ncbi:hypothetical protein FQZ97_828840 [compost metagenome]
MRRAGHLGGARGAPYKSGRVTAMMLRSGRRVRRAHRTGGSSQARWSTGQTGRRHATRRAGHLGGARGAPYKSGLATAMMLRPGRRVRRAHRAGGNSQAWWSSGRTGRRHDTRRAGHLGGARGAPYKSGRATAMMLRPGRRVRRAHRTGGNPQARWSSGRTGRRHAMRRAGHLSVARGAPYKSGRATTERDDAAAKTTGPEGPVVVAAWRLRRTGRPVSSWPWSPRLLRPWFPWPAGSPACGAPRRGG